MGARNLLTVLAIGFYCSCAAAGCETAKGSACGIGKATTCVADGVKKDVKNAGNAVQRTDAWIRKNLW